MRKQENRRGNSEKWTASRRASRPGPSGLACRSQLGKGAVAGAAPSPFLQPLRSLHIFEFLPGKGGGGSEAASLGVSQHLLRDAFVGSPSFPLRTFLGSGEGEGGVGGWKEGVGRGWLLMSKSPSLTLFKIFICVASVLTGFSPV